MLIPKVKNVDKMMDFRPINLCMWHIDKIIAKTMANHLKRVLPYITDEA